MKKQQREVYIELTSEIDQTLCTVCKFSSGGCEAQECEHPLFDFWGFPGNDYFLEPGCDCWGFRRAEKITPTELADMIGFMLTEADWKNGISWVRSVSDGLIHFDYYSKEPVNKAEGVR